jgi:predicted nucleotidyltransferase
MCSKAVLDTITGRVCAAAKEVLGDKLEKVLLYGSYARGDYDEYSDIDIFVLADIRLEDARRVGSEIDRITGDLDLEYDVVVSLHVTCSSIFHRFRNVMPYFMNVQKDGVELAYA